jgi:hypothetical protein
MNILMRGENAVPILIDHTTVYKEPKVNRTRRFVGLRAGLKILAAKAVDVVLESFWEVQQDVLDAGHQETTHYAIQVSDPDGADQPELVVSRLDGKGRPGCGLYFNVIRAEKEDPKQTLTPPSQPESRARLVNPKLQRPSPQTPSSIIKELIDPEMQP